MKKHFFYLLFALLLSHLSQVMPSENSSPKGHGYLGLLSGVSFRYTENNSGFYKSFFPGSVTGIFGDYDFNRWKIEVEISDIENAMNLSTSKTKTFVSAQEWSIIFMTNGYYVPFDFNIVRPYVGVGTGYGIHSYACHRNNPPPPGDVFDFNHVRQYSNGFSYQVMSGLEFLLNKQVNLDLEYRFWSMPHTPYKEFNGDKGIDSINSSANIVLLKLIYKFP